MGEVLREVEQSIAFRELIRTKEPTCFLCSYIRRDLEQNGKLTGWPLDFFNKADFPIDAKLIHVILELGVEPPREDPEDNDDLASVVLHLLETVQESN
jgi:hypothetical protein